MIINWNKLPREVEESPCLETLKTWLNQPWATWSSWTWFEQRDCTHSLEVLSILWYMYCVHSLSSEFFYFFNQWNNFIITTKYFKNNTKGKQPAMLYVFSLSPKTTRQKKNQSRESRYLSIGCATDNLAGFFTLFCRQGNASCWVMSNEINNMYAQMLKVSNDVSQKYCIKLLGIIVIW